MNKVQWKTHAEKIKLIIKDIKLSNAKYNIDKLLKEYVVLKEKHNNESKKSIELNKEKLVEITKLKYEASIIRKL